ncbi:MAG: GH92 family glycosyl hydrolase [Porphyromonas sp.]|nr:GH92 family glycosyl hydrolase [Porphyromonas sp.]
MRQYTTLYLALFFLPLLLGCSKPSEERLAPTEDDLIYLVDPFIGTGFHGHTYPGAAAPMGMAQLSPESRWEGWDACSGYHYDDDSLYGFAHTHLSGTGCSDLGDIIMIPTTDSEPYLQSITDARLPKIGFKHSDEQAHAGYYRVELESGVVVELTASSLMGVHRYTFPRESRRAHIVLDLVNIKGDEIIEAALTQTSDSTLSGYTISNGWAPERHIYFAAHFSQPIEEGQVYLNGVPTEGIAKGDSVRGIFSYTPVEGAPLEIFVGLSQTSMEAAEANLRAEMSKNGNTFDAVRKSTEERWTEVLSRASIAEGKREDLVNFYTSLYHSFLAPNQTSDADGSYRGMDGNIQKGSGTSYSTLSLWDTFRALHPLVNLLYPEVTPDISRSMMQMYKEQGELPIWPLFNGETGTMIGYHAVSVLADAHRMGLLGDLDPHEVLSAMVHSSNINKKGSDYYTRLGFIPSNARNESVSCTLEYSYDDWCIARMAEALGDMATAEEYYARAYNYRKVFDGDTRFFRGRHEDGSWAADFDPYEVSKDFTEATAWHYRFAPMHDVNGLVALFGGEEQLLEALDQLFSDQTSAGDLQDITGIIGQYAHGNEPSHHYAYLYNYLGKPWRTQELTHQIIDEMYSATPEGLCGNEDCGQLSAWYAMSAMGLYPFAPGSGELLLTSPLFQEVTLKLTSGELTITTDKDPKDFPYIKSVTLNGKELHRLYVSTDEIAQGGTLAYQLSKDPVTDFVIEEAPYSMTRELFVSPVYTPDDIALFDGKVEVSLATATPGATIYFSINGGERELYSEPIEVSESCQLTVTAEREGMLPAPTTTLVATRADYAPGLKVETAKKGTQWTLYAGSVATTEEIAALPVVGSGRSDVPSIEMRDREDLFALIFTGYIEVPATDVYEFRLTSDDGSVLKIHDQAVVLNDGSHAYVSATGKAALEEGLHPFTLLYWQGSEGKGLKLEYRRRSATEYTSPNFYTK